MTTVRNPSIPYLEEIDNFEEGKTLTIEGCVIYPAQKITIRFQTGECNNDIALQVQANILEGNIIRNAFIKNKWGDDESDGHYPLIYKEKFKISVTCQKLVYIVKVDNSTIEFKHRLTNHESRVNHISIEGDVELDTISYNWSFVRNIPFINNPPSGGRRESEPWQRNYHSNQSSQPNGAWFSQRPPSPPRGTPQQMEDPFNSWGTVATAAAIGTALVGAYALFGGQKKK